MASPLRQARTVAPEPQAGADLRDEVLTGLRRPRKELPCKLFYNAAGSQLFDRICELPEYYPTRTETTILREQAPQIGAALGDGVVLVEYGSGSSLKTGLLLDELREPAAYVPLDISREHLWQAAARLAGERPGLDIRPVCADYTQPITPPGDLPAGRRVAFYPGSSLGNFHPTDAVRFLRRVRATVGRDGALVLGVDLKKDPAVLHAAYNDAQGVTAAFNRNLLVHLNRELEADFEPEAFHHYAFYNPCAGRIEMHLISQAEQEVRIGSDTVSFAEGETIWTESSYKYTLDLLARRASEAGWVLDTWWTDERRWFAVALLVPAAGVR